MLYLSSELNRYKTLPLFFAFKMRSHYNELRKCIGAFPLAIYGKKGERQGVQDIAILF